MVTNLPEKFVVDKKSLTEIVSGTEWEGFAKKAVAVRHHDERNQFNVEFYDGAGGFLGVAYYLAHVSKPAHNEPYGATLMPTKRKDMPKMQVSVTNGNISIEVLN